MLNEFVLFRSFSPIVFSVSYAEAEHAIIRRIPEKSKSRSFYNLKSSIYIIVTTNSFWIFHKTQHTKTLLCFQLERKTWSQPKHHTRHLNL
jgi:hypothetical protein